MEIRRNRQAPKIVERFRYKATKAAMAQSKLKEIERLGTVETPRRFDTSTFASSFQPEYESVRDALFVKDLVFGNDKPLGEISLAVERGQKIGVIGSNGTGKSTLLKTITGIIPPLSGDVRFGVKTRVGYFDQTIAATKSELSVLEDFRAEFPELNDGEIRKRWEDSCFRATTFSSASKICRAAKGAPCAFKNIPPSSQLPDSRRADQPHGHHRQGNP